MDSKRLERKKEKKRKNHLRITGTESKAPIHKRRRVRFAGIGKLIDDGIEIRWGWAMANANDGQCLTVGLEILPWAWRSTAQNEFKTDGPGVPWLVRERWFLVLSVEGADRREWDRMKREQHRVIVPQNARRHCSSRQHRHLNHRRAFNTHIGLHCREQFSRRQILWQPVTVAKIDLYS